MVMNIMHGSLAYRLTAELSLLVSTADSLKETDPSRDSVSPANTLGKESLKAAV
jgi:hypothetical protein